MKDGGPAFPVIAENGLGHISEGQSLRDWFAGCSLPQELKANGDYFDPSKGENDTWLHELKPNQAIEVAKNCYLMADAMLEAREAKND